MPDGSSGRRWSRIFRLDARAEVEDELAFHLEQRVRDNITRGMEAETARAAALQRLGDLKSVQRECTELLTAERRSEARRDWLKFSWLDFKLGFRMLVKYPGLTLVGGLAIAFAIWVGASTFEFVTQALHPTLPLDQGDRVVGLRMWDAAAGRVEQRVAHDFMTWREQLESIDDVGAFRRVERNLITEDGAGVPIEVAEISASAFRVARVPALLGRPLVEADEQTGAPAVAVIGYDVWQTRFESDGGVVGRTVRLGREQVTIVGVMPEGFAFPVSQSLWVPLRVNVLEFERGQGPALRMFGRLAPGATVDQARAELATLGQRAAIDFRETHEHLRPQVLPYARSILNLGMWETTVLRSSNVFVLMLLILVFGNVALLMFARAATRENEIVVRNALGASRGRIITQLFAEALVLGGVAAILGLAAVRIGLRSVLDLMQAEFLDGAKLPFWFNYGLGAGTVLYTVVLTVIVALIAGVIPGLKVTRGLQARLRQAAAGGGGPSFGGIWTAVIVTQVAVTLLFPVVAWAVREEVAQIRTVEVGFPAEEYLSVRLEMDGQTAAGESVDTSRAEFLARFRATYEELERRLAADPAVAGVTFADFLPRMYHAYRLIEVDEGGAAPMDPRWAGYRVSSANTGPEFFDVLRTPILMGRGFHSGDLESGQRVVIVNQSLVNRVFGGRNPIGRRIRYVYFEEWDEPRSADEAPAPWFEIIGMVGDMAMAYGDSPKVAGLYHPATPEAAYPLQMAVHVRGEQDSFAPRLRAAAAAVDPALRLYDVQRLDQVNQSELEILGFWFGLTMMVSGMAIFLSLAGIYAVMSFTVARRTREIGIRVALGAQRRRVILATFARPLAQVGLGVVAGSALIGAFAFAATEDVSAKGIALIIAYAALMMGVCMLASIVPTRRALRVQPIDALKAAD